jgi:hypothetical protein
MVHTLTADFFAMLPNLLVIDFHFLMKKIVIIGYNNHEY